jgi:hypothetical protein
MVVMKRILSILAIIIFVTAGAFAADEFTQDSAIEQVNENQVGISAQEQIDEQIEDPLLATESADVIVEEKVAKPAVVNKKVYIDNYFSINPLLGFTLSPFDSTDQYIASGLEFSIFRYYGYMNYGTYFKLATLGEHFAYGSYEFAFGRTYRFFPLDKFELFANIGPSVTYYNDRLEVVGADKTNLLYVGAETAIGLRFYPFKEDNVALDIGLTGTYMYNIPFSSNSDTVIASRYSVIGFVGYTYAYRGKPKEQQPNK